MSASHLSTSDQLLYLKRLLGSTQEGFCAVDTQGCVTLCNATFLQLLGYASASEIVGKTLQDALHPASPAGGARQGEEAFFSKAAQSDKAAFVPYDRVTRKDGTFLPVEYRTEPVLENGAARGVIYMFQSIQDRLQAESHLQEISARSREIERKLFAARGQYQTLFTMINQGFCLIEMIFDEAGKAVDYVFIEVNPVFARQSGLHDVIGKRMRKDLAPNLEPLWCEAYGTVVASGEPVTFVDFARALGRWFEVFAFRFDAANPHLVAVLFTDVTSRQLADISLQESQAHLNLMIESAQDYAIISLDKDGIISSWNNGAERIFGGTSKDMIGKPFDTLFTPEDKRAGAALHEISTAAKDGRASDERWHLRKNGERFYASGILASMRDANGNITGFIKIARDMTTEKNAQENLLAARNAAEAANIAKTEFLANMSHEIRTPMNAIIGLANILAMSQPLTPKQRDFVKTLQMSADSLLSLINDLLDIAKIEARTVELEHIPFCLAQVVQEVVSMMAVRVREKGLRFTSEGEGVENRMFIGDPTRLRQIILNLCSNAIKFTDQGSVHVAITSHPTASPETEMIRIAVTDTGIGIAPDKLGTIFQKFVQADSSINRKYGGTGLGLAITKTLADIMEGTITVQSEADAGSTFIVSVPLKRATTEDVATFDGSLPALMEHATERTIRPCVLLVEDYAPNVLVATTFLEHFGYDVETASNGMEAVEMMKDGRHAVALMDVQMHGMNGLEATQLIRGREKQQASPRMPIIGMTAHALSGDRERCLAAGMDDYIAKPFDPAQLEALLSRIITGETL